MAVGSCKTEIIALVFQGLYLKNLSTYQTMKDALILIKVLSVFICSFLLLAPLFGYLGDRYNRKYIIIGGLSVWLGTAAASSFVTASVSKTKKPSLPAKYAQHAGSC